MRGRQLELDFESAIAEALADPVVARPVELWDSLQPSLTSLDHASQLKMAGQLFSDVAEVIHQRSMLLIEDWQDRNNTEGPIPDEDFLSGLVQETMFLDVSELVRQPKGRKPPIKSDDGIESCVAIVEKEVLLQELELQEAEDVLAVVEEEDVRAWVDAIAQRLQAKGGSDSLVALQQHLKLSWGGGGGGGAAVVGAVTWGLCAVVGTQSLLQPGN